LFQDHDWRATGINKGRRESRGFRSGRLYRKTLCLAAKSTPGIFTAIAAESADGEVGVSLP
ncbi:hypothetical protein PS057_21520, partial [Yersinia pestis]|nr:hypothetical protein [Yersinia pestis]